MITPKDVLNYQIADRMPLFNMWRAIWRFFYDEKSCQLNHRGEIEKEILKWHSVIKYQKKIIFEKYGPQPDIDNKPMGTKGTLIDEIEFQICRMCQVLVYKDTGVWQGEDGHKPFSLETVLKHKLEYKKLPMCMEVFPEVVKDFKKGQDALKVNMEDQPELYNGEAGKEFEKQ